MVCVFWIRIYVSDRARRMCCNQCVVFTVWTIYALAALLTLTVIAMVAKLVLPHVTVK